MSNIMVRKYLGRSRLAQELLEDVLIVENDNVPVAQDIEAMVAECLELEKLLTHTWQHVLELLFAVPQVLTDAAIDKMGMTMEMALEKNLALYGNLGRVIESAQRQGRTIKDAADFWIAHQNIKRIKEDVARKFPPLDEQMRKDAVEAFHRGECQSAEDLLREAQGHR